MHQFNASPVRVHLIAPPMMAWGLERLVQSAHPHIEFAGSSPSIIHALESLEKQPPDVVVADVEEPDDFDRLAQLHERIGSSLIVVTGSHDTSLLDKAVLAGVRGVVRTNEPPGTLLKAIEKVHEGELWIDRGTTSRIFIAMARQKAAQGDDPEKTRIATLTMRERQTVVAVASDAKAPAKVIARRLCISEHTLRNHLTSIYSKLELSNRVDLYAFATRHQLVDRAGEMMRR